MSLSTSKVIYIDEPISGQIIGGWVAVTAGDPNGAIFGPFNTKEEAIQYASQFDWAKVSPLYWATSSRG